MFTQPSLKYNSAPWEFSFSKSIVFTVWLFHYPKWNTWFCFECYHELNENVWQLWSTQLFCFSIDNINAKLFCRFLEFQLMESVLHFTLTLWFNLHLFNFFPHGTYLVLFLIVFRYTWHRICHLTHFSMYSSVILKLHIVVQPSPPPISRTLSIMQNWDSAHYTAPHSLLPEPSATTVLSVPVNLTTLGTSCRWNHEAFDFCVTNSFHCTSCPQASSLL